MCPQLQEIVIALEGLAGGFADALEHFWQISQVVNVMRLCGSWQQLFWGLNFSVKFDCWLNDAVFHACNGFG
jgi:hypothetical protein